MISSITKLLFIACLATALSRKSTTAEALLLGNFIGCNSFGCRLSALETDVAQLKQQVARLDPSGSPQGMNNFQRPNSMLPFNQGGMNNPNMNNPNMNNPNMNNPNMNNPNMNNPNMNSQQGNQQQGSNQQGGNANSPTVSYALDYPVMNNPNLRRNSNYPGSLNSGQFV